MNHPNSVLNLFDRLVTRTRPVNLLVNAVADLILPLSTAKAECSGCGEHCSYMCDPGTGTVYKLFRTYFWGTCEYSCCGAPGCCREVTSITC
jgi:hypothetical protein